MAKFVFLLNWTDQGIRNYPDAAKRADAAAAMFASLGGKLEQIYWTLGPYDVVTVASFPDDATATAAALRSAQLGNIRTLTMRAFGRDEIDGIIAKAKG